MKWAYVVAALVFGLAAAGVTVVVPFVTTSFNVAAGYSAKLTCSAVFVAGRDPAHVYNHELSGTIGKVTDVAVVNREERYVTTTASLFGFFPVQRLPLASDDVSLPPAPTNAWPARLAHGDGEEVDRELLNSVIEEQLDPAKHRDVDTRAIIVVRNGRIVAERYGPDFQPHTRLASWSNAKSVISTLIGIRIAQGHLRLDQTRLFPEWSNAADPRSNITLANLLHMSSGLEFDEKYDRHSDARDMLFLRPSMSDFAVNKPLIHAPGTKWAYSSGTSNLLARLLRSTFATDEEYWAFPRQALYEPLGMDSALMETDAAGTFVGSSYMYATARDWAKFGQLFLNEGQWPTDGDAAEEHQQVLTPGWVRYVQTPAPASKHRYSAQWWLNGAATEGKGDDVFDAASADLFWQRELPTDAYWAHGFEHQFVMVVPSRKAVIVRLGRTPDVTKWDLARFFRVVFQALPPSS
ncbi:betalactamase [Acanthamoeba castellanii str. Neff]|uniref:Betalactamase n=1 Tax=Acanthamoeba castellanii (strain ATCC 30010 / Neff) TaxID=1257118 RepID=L8GZ04_ACACF|nr:betalactamase [Acanthamoeba castellanii str. Neff]ELR17768.1 betalactamase [Acanthamoeba castellanii str. Neff]